MRLFWLAVFSAAAFALPAKKEQHAEDALDMSEMLYDVPPWSGKTDTKMDELKRLWKGRHAEQLEEEVLTGEAQLESEASEKAGDISTHKTVPLPVKPKQKSSPPLCRRADQDYSEISKKYTDPADFFAFSEDTLGTIYTLPELQTAAAQLDGVISRKADQERQKAATPSDEKPGAQYDPEFMAFAGLKPEDVTPSRDEVLLKQADDMGLTNVNKREEVVEIPIDNVDLDSLRKVLDADGEAGKLGLLLPQLSPTSGNAMVGSLYDGYYGSPDSDVDDDFGFGDVDMEMELEIEGEGCGIKKLEVITEDIQRHIMRIYFSDRFENANSTVLGVSPDSTNATTSQGYLQRRNMPKIRHMEGNINVTDFHNFISSLPPCMLAPTIPTNLKRTTELDKNSDTSVGPSTIDPGASENYALLSLYQAKQNRDAFDDFVNSLPGPPLCTFGIKYTLKFLQQFFNGIEAGLYSASAHGDPTTTGCVALPPVTMITAAEEASTTTTTVTSVSITTALTITVSESSTPTSSGSYLPSASLSDCFSPSIPASATSTSSTYVHSVAEKGIFDELPYQTVKRESVSAQAATPLSFPKSILQQNRAPGSDEKGGKSAAQGTRGGVQQPTVRNDVDPRPFTPKQRQLASKIHFSAGANLQKRGEKNINTSNLQNYKVEAEIRGDAADQPNTDAEFKDVKNEWTDLINEVRGTAKDVATWRTTSETKQAGKDALTPVVGQVELSPPEAPVGKDPVEAHSVVMVEASIGPPEENTTPLEIDSAGKVVGEGKLSDDKKPVEAESADKELKEAESSNVDEVALETVEKSAFEKQAAKVLEDA